MLDRLPVQPTTNRREHGPRAVILVAVMLAIAAPAASRAGEELGACCLEDGMCLELTQPACEHDIYCMGDANCDSVVDFADIDPFVTALQGEASWPTPACPWRNADCNGDATVDFADIDPFVARLGSSCLPTGVAGVWRGAGTTCSAGQCLVDCNNNGVHDRTDVLNGTSADCNLDLIPDECQDENGDGLNDICQIEDGELADVNGNWIADAVEYDCDADGIPDAFEISLGLAQDCNENGAPDACEIALHMVDDCNADQIPDECQLAGNDCNGNFVPDECDVDEDQNGIPDDCEPPRGAALAGLSGDQTMTDGGERTQAVELNIYNGLLGACGSPTSTSCGGQLVPDNLEFSRGAVTVANLNDTNGDGVVDRDQMVVVASSSAGRNEVDLMRLDLVRPTQFDPNTSRVILSVVSGAVRAWHSPTKVEEQPLPFSFHPQALPPVLTLWIEAVEPSTALRDIHLRAEHRVDGNLVSSDEVRATAVWAEQSLVLVTRSTAPDENTIPTDADDTGYKSFINTSLAADGTRFGVGTNRRVGQAPNWVDTFASGRILQEFTVSPPSLETLPTVKWNITRQVYARDHSIASGSGSVLLWTPVYKQLYPEAKTPPQNVETPNDDSGGSDEDNFPSNRHIYSWDTPGQPRSTSVRHVEQAFWVRRDSFREYVRVRVGEGQHFNETNGALEGSRASGYFPWHYVDYLVRDPAGLWVKDPSPVSASSPVRAGQGNGTATVTLLSQAVTEGFVATYVRSTKTWTLTGSGGASVTSSSESAQFGARWTLRIPDRVVLTIVQGRQTFHDDSRFTFSVFKTESATGKRSLNGTGATDPLGPP